MSSPGSFSWFFFSEFYCENGVPECGSPYAEVSSLALCGHMNPTLDLAFLIPGLCSRYLEIYWLSYVWDFVEVIWMARQSKDNGFLVSWPKTLSVLSFGIVPQNYLALLWAWTMGHQGFVALLQTYTPLLFLSFSTVPISDSALLSSLFFPTSLFFCSPQPGPKASHRSYTSLFHAVGGILEPWRCLQCHRTWANDQQLQWSLFHWCEETEKGFFVTIAHHVHSFNNPSLWWPDTVTGSILWTLSLSLCVHT